LILGKITMRCNKVSKGIIELLEKNGALQGMPKSDQVSMFDF